MARIPAGLGAVEASPLLCAGDHLVAATSGRALATRSRSRGSAASGTSASSTPPRWASAPWRFRVARTKERWLGSSAPTSTSTPPRAPPPKACRSSARSGRRPRRSEQRSHGRRAERAQTARRPPRRRGSAATRCRLPATLLSGKRIVGMAPSGTSIDSEETMTFSALTPACVRGKGDDEARTSRGGLRARDGEPGAFPRPCSCPDSRYAARSSPPSEPSSASSRRSISSVPPRISA